MNDETIGALIGSVYTAADDPSHWPVLLEELSIALDSANTAMMFQETGNDAASVSVAVRSDPEALSLYQSYYSSRNVFFIEAARQGRRMISGELLSDGDIDERILLHSEYYGDFLEPNNIRYSAGLVVANEEGMLSLLSTMRSRSAGAFGAHEFRILRALRPHLQRAVQIHRRLHVAEARAALGSTLLDSLEVGVVLITGNGQVEYTNGAADRIIRTADGITIRKRMLVCSSPEANSLLTALVAKALRFCAGGTGPAGGAMRVARAGGDSAYEVLVGPIGTHPMLKTKVMVIIRDPSAYVQTERSVLRALYRFTEAEARLAESLLNGMTIERSADNLGVSYHTAKTQLRSIFEKTGTKRQSEVVRLLSRSVAAFRM